jgi:hypothetical protein
MGEYKQEASVRCYFREREITVADERAKVEGAPVSVPAVSLLFADLLKLLQARDFNRRLDFVSPHLAPVGGEIDMTGVVAKGSHE